MCVAPKFIGINQADGIGKSGEAYAYAASCFHLVQLPVAVGEAFWLPLEKHDFVIHYGETSALMLMTIYHAGQRPWNSITIASGAPCCAKKSKNA